MRPVYLVILLALLPCRAHAANAGVFCKGSMFFIARPEPTGTLTFKIMGSNPNQNIVEVGGVAFPHVGGWRYQVKSMATPEDRCTLDINNSSGSYSVRSFDGARCENMGGQGAYEMLMNANFPAASRVSGVVPPAGSPDDFPAFDCAHRRFYTSGPPAAVKVSTAQVLGAAPIGVVRGLIARDMGGWGNVFAEQPTAVMREYFTDGFNRSWAKAMTHNQTEPVLDGDPITGWQGVTHVEERATSGGEVDGTTARVVAELRVTADGQTKPEKVVFDLRLENQHWKVDDITDPGMPSIRSYLQKSYGG